MQAVQFTHSSWMPLRMSMPVGQTVTHWPQSTQSPLLRGAGASRDQPAARLAPRRSRRSR